jgi:hypothetical protein
MATAPDGTVYALGNPNLMILKPGDTVSAPKVKRSVSSIRPMSARIWSHSWTHFDDHDRARGRELESNMRGPVGLGRSRRCVRKLRAPGGAQAQVRPVDRRKFAFANVED